MVVNKDFFQLYLVCEVDVLSISDSVMIFSHLVTTRFLATASSVEVSH